MSVPIRRSAVIAIIIGWTASRRARDADPHCIRDRLNILIRGAVEFTHVVSVHYIESSILPTADQFMRKLSRGCNDDPRACPQIQVVVVEKETRREVIEYLERLIAAGRQFQVSVSVIAD